MKRKEVEAKVIEIVTEQGYDWNKKIIVIPESNLFSDLGFDSMDIVELIVALEEDFGVEIPDDVAEEFVTVKDVIDCVSKALSGR